MSAPIRPPVLPRASSTLFDPRSTSARPGPRIVDRDAAKGTKITGPRR